MDKVIGFGINGMGGLRRGEDGSVRHGGVIGGLIARLWLQDPGAYPNIAPVAFNAPGCSPEEVGDWVRVFDGTLPQLLPPRHRHYSFNGHDDCGGIQVALHGSRAVEDIPWGEDVDVIIDAVGFKSREQIIGHGRPVWICCPPDGDSDGVHIFGVNHEDMTVEGNELFLSPGSCTTNAVCVFYQVLKQAGVTVDFMDWTLPHALTPSQLKKDAGTALHNWQPASTGASKAVTAVFPELAGKLHFDCIRAPVHTASYAKCAIHLPHAMTAEEINEIFRAFAVANPGLMHYEPVPDDPKNKKLWKHSGACVGQPYVVFFDARQTVVHKNGRLAIVHIFYDNRVGFSYQVLRLLNYWAGRRLALQQAEERAAK